MGAPTDQEVGEAIQSLVERLRTTLGECHIVLFGSRARGTHLLTSDVDLLIVSRAFAGLREDDRMVRVLELWEGPVSLQPLCYTPTEFEERRRAISIVRVAAEEGRALG